MTWNCMVCNSNGQLSGICSRLPFEANIHPWHVRNGRFQNKWWWWWILDSMNFMIRVSSLGNVIKVDFLRATVLANHTSEVFILFKLKFGPNPKVNLTKNLISRYNYLKVSTMVTIRIFINSDIPHNIKIYRAIGCAYIISSLFPFKFFVYF